MGIYFFCWSNHIIHINYLRISFLGTLIKHISKHFIEDKIKVIIAFTFRNNYWAYTSFIDYKTDNFTTIIFNFLGIFIPP